MNNLNLKYNSIFGFSFILVLFLTNYLIPEIQTVLFIIIITFLLYKINIIRINLFSFLLPLIIYLIIGTLSINSNDSSNVIKDYYYILKPIFCLLLGFLMILTINDYKKFIKILLTTGTLLSIIRIFQFLLFVLFEQGNMDIYEFRNIYGSGSMVSILLLTLIHLLWKYNDKTVSKNTLMITGIINLLSVLLSFARVYIIILFISFFIISELYKLLKIKNILRIAIFSSFIFFIIAISFNIFENSLFKDKISKTFEELVIKDYSGSVDINLFWRGYESYKGIEVYSNSSWPEFFIGRGFGYLLNLGFVQTLRDEPMQYIPILHNGYVYILLKTGFLGLLCYLWFFISLLRNKIQNKDKYNIINQKFLMVTSIILLITTFVDTGLFNKDMYIPFHIILGSLIAFRNTALINKK